MIRKIFCLCAWRLFIKRIEGFMRRAGGEIVSAFCNASSWALDSLGVVEGFFSFFSASAWSLIH